MLTLELIWIVGWHCECVFDGERMCIMVVIRTLTLLCNMTYVLGLVPMELGSKSIFLWLGVLQMSECSLTRARVEKKR